MIDPNAFLGVPFDFQGLCKIYPPKVKDILENSNYRAYTKILLISQEDIEDELSKNGESLDDIISPFKYILSVAESNKKLYQLIKDGISFFIKEPVILAIKQKMILIGDLKETLSTINSLQEIRIINEDNFFEFQNALRKAIGEKELEPYQEELNPKIKEFKAKARLRDKVKAKSKDNLTLGSTLASICCMGLGITPLNIGELSCAALPALMRYYQEKNKYEIDIKSLLAGADSNKVKPIFWIRNIEED